MSRWIDISVPLRTGMVHWPGDPEFQMSRFADMDRDKIDYNVSMFTMGCHLGTQDRKSTRLNSSHRH